MTYGPYEVMIDFGIMSTLLIVAQILRAKIKLFQNLYLPASLIAGVMGIFLGKDFLNILPFSAKIGSYSYLLSCVLFAGLFIGNRDKISFKKIWDEAGDTFTLNTAMEVGQYGFSLLVGGFLLTLLFPQVPKAFAILMPSGFAGGFAYASSIGGMITEITGWPDAISVAQTFATIGLLVGVGGGIILINIYCRRGATRFVKDIKNLPEDMKSGFIDKERQIIGEQTTSPAAIDSITWHFGLIGIACVSAYFIYLAIQPFIEISFINICLIMSILLNVILKFLNFSNYVDKQVTTRLGSSVADYLVGFGIASISTNVVMSYAGPILLLVAIGLVHCMITFFINRKLYHNFWFERSIFVYGWSCGLISLGITLLRIVDPEFKSKTLEDYGIAAIGITPFEMALVSVLPVFVANGFVYESGAVCLLIAVALIFLCWKKYGTSKYKDHEIRDSEREIMNKLK